MVATRDRVASLIAALANLAALPQHPRTVGAGSCAAPYVALADDHSWWEPGALARAADLLEAWPRLGLIAGRVLVGPEARRTRCAG